MQGTPHARGGLILADWRAAERRLAVARPGTDEERVATADVERLRDEYRRRMEAGFKREEP